MAKPNSYRKVSESTLKRCNTCKHFTKLTSWCNRWNFVAKELYVCGKWTKASGDMEEESDLKKRYKVAAGEKLIVREENYAKPIFKEPKSDDYEQGWMYRYFAKQSNNPYGDIIEIDDKQYRSAGSKNSGLDGTHYEVIRVQWVISGDIREVEASNTRIADWIERKHPKMNGLKRLLYDNLLKNWDGSKNNK